ncbi:MAG TPA: fluoride efflux transporter CrcB [Gemmatimonadaceae bacterium]
MPSHWSLQALLSVALGGAAGSVARYLIGGVIQRVGTGFPYGTLAVNVTGSFLLGVLMPVLLARATAPEVRLFLTIGFCGGYTTFSTFAYESTLLLQDGRLWRAGIYIVLSAAMTIAAMLAGFSSGRLILHVHR